MHAQASFNTLSREARYSQTRTRTPPGAESRFELSVKNERQQGSFTPLIEGTVAHHQAWLIPESTLEKVTLPLNLYICAKSPLGREIPGRCRAEKKRALNLTATNSFPSCQVSLQKTFPHILLLWFCQMQLYYREEMSSWHRKSSLNPSPFPKCYSVDGNSPLYWKVK